eukprot:684524-Amphidinium_carterae.1
MLGSLSFRVPETVKPLISKNGQKVCKSVGVSGTPTHDIIIASKETRPYQGACAYIRACPAMLLWLVHAVLQRLHALPRPCLQGVTRRVGAMHPCKVGYSVVLDATSQPASLCCCLQSSTGLLARL